MIFIKKTKRVKDHVCSQCDTVFFPPRSERMRWRRIIGDVNKNNGKKHCSRCCALFAWPKRQLKNVTCVARVTVQQPCSPNPLRRATPPKVVEKPILRDWLPLITPLLVREQHSGFFVGQSPNRLGKHSPRGVSIYWVYDVRRQNDGRRG